MVSELSATLPRINSLAEILDSAPYSGLLTTEVNTYKNSS